MPGLGSVEYKDWEGMMLSACDWGTLAWLISLSGCLVPSALVLACNPSLSDNILFCFLPQGSSLCVCLRMGVFAQSNAKMFWIASSELPQSYFRSCYYYDGAVVLTAKWRIYVRISVLPWVGVFQTIISGSFLSCISLLLRLYCLTFFSFCVMDIFGRQSYKIHKNQCNAVSLIQCNILTKSVFRIHTLRRPQL